VLSIWNRPLVTYRATVNGVEPAQRVRNARARIATEIDTAQPESVGVRAAEIGSAQGVVVTIGENVAFGIVADDLDAESALTLEEAAAHAASGLREVLHAREQQRRGAVIARGIGLTALAVFVFAVAFRLIVAARELAVQKLDALLRSRSFVLAGVDILPTLATVERATFRVLSWAAIGALAYVVLAFVLRLFPYTEPLGLRLRIYLMDQVSNAALAVVRSAPSLVAIVAVILITRALALWSSRLLAEIEHGARIVSWLAQEQARATRRIANGVIWILGAAIAYSMLPFSGSPIFRGMSLVLGLGVSLASAGLVNQWISGLVVLYSRSFRLGDYVRVGEIEGIITEMGPLAAKMRTIRREEVTIPNAVMTTDKLINFTRLGSEQGALLSVSLAIGYDVPWRQVEALLLQAAAATGGVRRKPVPRVLQWDLTDFYVQYQLHVYLEHADARATVRSDLNARILDAFTTAGVQIMTPHFESQPEKPVLATRASLASQ
jgi:small-conductance mechanosensitive channel